VRLTTLLLTLFCALASTQEPPDYVLVGPVQRIVDGDTLDVLLDSGTIRVRMHGIDTAERGQPFFKDASEEESLDRA
jgi:endonuclease YncB( thermonuclease family)